MSLPFGSEAFFAVCKDAQPARWHYVSLYAERGYYGGPEEGGWWGSDTELVAYYRCTTAEEAESLKERVQELARSLSANSKRQHGLRCAAECEWLEARGLDADFLPEPDGDCSYWVTTETQPGSCARTGSRHYE